uniref:Aldehyde oxidase/xanthine dehydrogenase second molybdopterin binding domain-containing protein n=1 Tax=Vannella robusta TaxID=1487602 RepID=A0A7S4HQQ8_9EUKA
MAETAVKMGMNVDQFREMNFYTKGQVTPAGGVLTYWNMDTIWNQIQQTANYAQRRSAIADFNQSNRWVKKGMYLMPCKYGIEWGGTGFGALINVCSDGTVQLSHTGCEVGQGINTKVSQVLAMELGCDISLITVTSTNSQKVPHGVSTGGSITSELCSKAVIGAARKLNAKLQPIKNLFPDYTWTELIKVASDAQLGLQSRYWQLSVNRTTDPFQYNAYGAAIAETRVDILTGEVQVQRVDVLYDCGTSLNPAIDIGQVEGGFVQGMGLYMTEKLKYDESGNITTNGTWEYKPPSTKDIPIDFRVTLLSDAPNPAGVLSSKASGEPPMTLSASVYFAVKEAVQEARKSAGLSNSMVLPPPVSPNVVGVGAGTSIPLLTLS